MGAHTWDITTPDHVQHVVVADHYAPGEQSFGLDGVTVAQVPYGSVVIRRAPHPEPALTVTRTGATGGELVDDLNTGERAELIRALIARQVEDGGDFLDACPVSVCDTPCPQCCEPGTYAPRGGDVAVHVHGAVHVDDLSRAIEDATAVTEGD